MPLIMPSLQSELIDIYSKGKKGNPAPKLVATKTAQAYFNYVSGGMNAGGQPFTAMPGSSEPALLGKAFTDLFKEHQHPSSVGPTGAVMPQYAAKIVGTMSKKVFLG